MVILESYENLEQYTSLARYSVFGKQNRTISHGITTSHVGGKGKSGLLNT